MDVATAQAQLARLADQVETVIVGKRGVIDQMLVGLIAGGHILFEDLPGVGKTTLVQALAQSLASDFRRVSFTPDLLPSDILGVTIYDRETNRFRLEKGPVFTTILLADEVNRATPRVQAALLEAMAEAQVTLDGTTYPLSEHFFVLATQNPSDYAGTYPLPEAQLDRFMMRLTVGYPAYQAELRLLQRPGPRPATLSPLMSEVTLSEIKALVPQVTVAPSLTRYLLDLVTATRQAPQVSVGVSPRGGLALLTAAQAHAVMAGRDYLLAEDIQALAPAVLGHRLAGVSTLEASQLVAALVKQLPVPDRW